MQASTTARQLARDGFARAGRIAGLGLGSGPDRPIRDVLATPGPARELARSDPLRAMATTALGRPAFPVRANLFVKSARADWFVGWHRDRVVAVRERHDVEGFSGWTVKAGLPHAVAPAAVLGGMIAIRVHLDPCGPDDGPLEVLPGSHRTDTDRAPDDADGVAITAAVGEAVWMRPLLLHRSARSRSHASRRVLHVEFAAEPLPLPLVWHYGPAAHDDAARGDHPRPAR